MLKYYYYYYYYYLYYINMSQLRKPPRKPIDSR